MPGRSGRLDLQATYQGENVMLKTMLAASVAIVALAALSSSPALAVTNTGTIVTLHGQATSECNMDMAEQTVDITHLSGSDGYPVTDELTNIFANGGEFWCNSANAAIRINLLPLTNTGFTGTAPAGFTNVVNYTLTGTLGSGTISYDTAAVGGTDQEYPVGVFATTTPTANVSLEATSDRVIAGDYSAILKLGLVPYY
jgi:hypothetical protein